MSAVTLNEPQEERDHREISELVTKLQAWNAGLFSVGEILWIGTVISSGYFGAKKASEIKERLQDLLNRLESGFI